MSSLQPQMNRLWFHAHTRSELDRHPNKWVEERREDWRRLDLPFPPNCTWSNQLACNRPGAYALPPAKGIEDSISLDKDLTVTKSSGAVEIVAFQRAIENALVKGGRAFLKKAIADDFSMAHGDSGIRVGA